MAATGIVASLCRGFGRGPITAAEAEASQQNFKNLVAQLNTENARASTETEPARELAEAGTT